MLARIDLRGTAGDLRALLARPETTGPDIRAAVAAIIADVKVRGEAAVRELTARFDGADLSDPRVDPAEIAAALERISPGLRGALELARDQIVAWHEAQREREARHERRGIEVAERVVAVDRAGCYVPGGRAPLASSVLMTALPARVAGVPDVILCSPPDSSGRVNDAILAAAAIAEVDEVYAIGGAQAVAAMAFGSGALRSVDVIVGPGNAYVVEAKRQVFGTVGIDGLAGASEVAIVADDTVDPAWVAVDLLAQAEHGPGGAVALIVWDEAAAERVELALDALLVTAGRRDEAASTLEVGGRIVLVADAAGALDAANPIAPARRHPAPRGVPLTSGRCRCAAQHQRDPLRSARRVPGALARRVAQRRVEPVSRPRRDRAASGARCLSRPAGRESLVRERQQRDSADAPAHLRRRGTARVDLRTDVSAARADRAGHRHRCPCRRAPTRLPHPSRRRDRRHRADP